MDLLARREHSCQELYTKLAKRSDDVDLIIEVVAKLTAENLQSDERFAHAYARSRSNRGFGPVRIENELRQRGVADHLIYAAIAEINWLPILESQWEKRCNGRQDLSFEEKMKHKRFLQYRGFHFEDILSLN